MSFSAELKNELLSANFKNNCCKTAFLYGLTFDALPDGNGGMSLSYCDEAVAETAKRLLISRFHRDVTLSERKYLGRTVYCLKTFSAAAWQFATENETADAYNKLFRCDQCCRAFLSGLFLSTGRIADPEKEIHLYFSLHNEERAPIISAILGHCCAAPKSIKRKNCTELYYKSSNDVTTLLTFLGVGKSLFDILNAQIEKEIRNQENRATNCDARNIGRAVEACNRSTRLIMKLKDSELWSALPVALKTTATLRLQHPTVSLTELGLLHTPPVTKSGVSHRLQKLNELALSLK